MGTSFTTVCNSTTGFFKDSEDEEVETFSDDFCITEECLVGLFVNCLFCFHRNDNVNVVGIVKASTHVIVVHVLVKDTIVITAR